MNKTTSDKLKDRSGRGLKLQKITKIQANRQDSYLSDYRVICNVKTKSESSTRGK